MQLSADLSKVTWYDDFLGVALRGEYHHSINGGEIGLSREPAIGGWLRLAAGVEPGSSARLRLGEEPGSSPLDHLNWSVEKGLYAETRLWLVATEDIEVTAGFVGPNDPDNVIAARYAERVAWVLQTSANGPGNSVRGDYRHAPAAPFTIGLRASPDRADFLIDGEAVASRAENIPACGLAWEFQIWNRGTDRPVLLADYLFIQQAR